MTRVLVVGGAGVFGSALVDSLAATTDCAILIAGRDLKKAQAAAAAVRQAHPGTEATGVALDTATATAADLTALGAGIVVDAAGPFQGTPPRLARAAIEAGLDYLDLADARDFVAAFPALDDAAKAAGTVAVTGMSSTPALSHAALDDLVAGWRRIDRVEAGISPGNRAPRGLSVVAAILSWAGQPLRVFADGGWTTRSGWSGTVRRPVEGLGRRRLALAETPDLDLLAQRYRPRDAALFRAGLELGVLHHGLAALATPVRLGLVASLAPLARPVRALADLFEPFGSDRGGMVVEALGRDADDRPCHARWSLVAESGCGPFVPALPALALVRRLACDRGSVASGARSGAGLLPLAAIAAEFERHAIATRRSLSRLTCPLETAAGPSFEALPAAIRAAHRAGPVAWLAGEAEVEGASSAPAGWIARLIGFPGAARAIPVFVTMRLEADGRETWVRDFGGRRFRSTLHTPRPGLVTERFGLFDFDLAVTADTAALTLEIVAWRFAGLPLPARLAPRSRAVEAVDREGRFTFDVPIALPLVGRLVRYRGWLRPAEAGPAPPDRRQ